ncbi:unnamed protein product, partial [marine sediment metagenome]
MSLYAILIPIANAAISGVGFDSLLCISIIYIAIRDKNLYAFMYLCSFC